MKKECTILYVCLSFCIFEVDLISTGRFRGMRRFKLFLCAVFCALSLSGQNTLIVHQKNRESISFGFDEKPVVTFTDTELIVKTTANELQFPFDNLYRFTFDVAGTGVDGIKDDLRSRISLDKYNVSINGAKPGLVVKIVSSDGKVIKEYETDADGNLAFSIEELSAGIYVISSESLNCRILKNRISDS